jgi:hypothetical protein
VNERIERARRRAEVLAAKKSKKKFPNPARCVRLGWQYLRGRIAAGATDAAV